jgi:phytoene dehydrogenase-like protein
VLFPEELVSVESPGGERFTVYTDIDRLERHMKQLSGSDSRIIDQYIGALRTFTSLDLIEDMTEPSARTALRLLAGLPSRGKWFGATVSDFADRFTDPFLRRAFPTIQYDDPNMPMAIHLNLLAQCARHRYGWPTGGSLKFARAIEGRYLDLGGEIEYRARVDEVMIADGQAIGVRLVDGREFWSDVVVSTAYGHSTVFGLLEGRYVDRSVRSLFANPTDRVSMGLQVSLGVARDLSREPHAMVWFLEQPMCIAGEWRDRLDLELFGFDPSMVPEGKGALKVMLSTSYSYWEELRRDRARYEAEKQQVADTVIGLLEGRFPGLQQEIEVVDVATPMTTERYTGNGRGFDYPMGRLSLGMLTGRGLIRTLPGLRRFYMAGQSAGTYGLFNVALMGRSVIREIVRSGGGRFVTTKH